MTTKKHQPLLGAHISIVSGLEKAIFRGESIGCTAIQIFTKSGRSWFEKELEAAAVERFKEAWRASTVQSVITHCGYLVNIGSPSADTESKSIASLKGELKRCELLGIPSLVLHPGSHTGDEPERCMKRIAHNLDNVLAAASGTTSILLETAAGQGTNIGSTFEELATIYEQVKHKELVGFCIDTCHIYSAGYDISTPEKYESVIKQWEKVLPIERVKAIHLNDSLTPFNSRKDRHENLGKGTIPLEIFATIVNDHRWKNVPIVLETPAEGLDLSGYERELKLLRSYLK